MKKEYFYFRIRKYANGNTSIGRGSRFYREAPRSVNVDYKPYGIETTWYFTTEAERDNFKIPGNVQDL